MRIGQLNEIQISLKDVDLLEMQGGFNSYKLPIGKLYNYFKGKLNLAPVAYSGNYQDLENIPPTRVASRGNLGIVRIGDNLEITPDGVLSGTPFRGWLPPDWEEEDEELASFIKNKPDLSVLATYEYVDERDEAVLVESKEHADGGDEVTLDVLRNYSDTNAANTLASAKEYADTQDATTLNSARSYTDAEVAGGVIEAKDYTDEREVAIRQTISDTLDEAKDYTDTEAASALTQANSYTDAEILASEGREDAKIDAVNTRIDGLEDTLGEGYVFSVDGRQGVVDLSGSYEQKRKNNLEATTDPTPNDDISEGYEILSKWINQATGEMWVCIQDTEGAANWQHHTLTIDELGSAATADVGTASNQLPTNAIVDGKLSAGLDTKVDKVVGKQLSDENFTLAEKNKLAEAVIDSDPRLTDSREWISPTVTQVEAEAGTSTERRAFTPERVRQATEAWWQGSPSKEKLDSIEDEATKNATDAQLRDRATHTGEQPISSVTGLQTVLDGKADIGDIPDISNLATKQEVEDLDSSLSSVAKSGNYGDLVNTPTLGSASEQDVSFFATAGQGALADTAVQPDDLIPYALIEDIPQNTDEIPEGAINKYITQAEKDKLAGIGPNHYKGIFATLADLIAGVPSPVAGDYAEVSGDENEPTQRYFWDSVISEWVPQGGAVTPEEVKTLYESNPNTNAFTDNEKSKLSGIQMGATANATNAQLRDRSTHTGTQAISTVSGLQDALDGKLQNSGGEIPITNTGGIRLLLDSAGAGVLNRVVGKVGGGDSWSIGKIFGSSDDIYVSNLSSGTAISLRDDHINANKNLYVNNSLVFHQGNLDLNTVVRTSGAQSIGGSKVFTSSPEVPTPTFNGAAVNKQYVDEGLSEKANSLEFLKKPISSLSGASIDEIGESSARDSGVYYQPVSGQATAERGYPHPEAGTLLVTPSAYAVQQMYITYSSNRIFVRGLSGTWKGSGPWGPWREVGAWDTLTGKPNLGTAATHNVTTSLTDLGSNKVLRTKDFGIGEAIPLPPGGTDLNDLLQPAEYRWDLARAPENLPVNVETSGYAYLKVTSWGDGAQQVCIPSSGNRMYFRVKQNSNAAWLPWVQLYHTGNFNPAGKMDVRAGGWMWRSTSKYIPGYPSNSEESISQIYSREETDEGVRAHASSIHFATDSTWGRLRVSSSPSDRQSWIQGGNSSVGVGWTEEIAFKSYVDTLVGDIEAYVDEELSQKVDKQAGYGLSQENYSLTEKNKLSGIESGAQVNTITSVAGRTGAVTLSKSDVGLSNVDNTSDANKPVSTAQATALAGKANVSHTHDIADINGLEGALDAKANVTDLSSAIPRGIISMWSGALNTIPSGWALCDGSNGTPDLRDRFVIAAGGSYTVGSTGDGSIPSHSHGSGSLAADSNGAHTHTASTGSAGSHGHSGTASSAGAHSHSINLRTGSGQSTTGISKSQYTNSADGTISTNSAGAHTHSLSINANGAHTHTVTVTSGGGHTHAVSGTTSASGSGTAVIAKYYALAYIMKL